MAQRASAGRGRHRKPSNRTRTVGLATAPLAAAIPFAMTSPAQAATTNTWERLAACEVSCRVQAREMPGRSRGFTPRTSR